MQHSQAKKWSALLAVLALITSTFLIVQSTAPAQAADRPFNQYFGQHAKGAITITGNSLSTCHSSEASCDEFLAGTTTKANNNFNMKMLDVDDDASTFNSSMAALDMPAGSTVLYAGLFWGASTKAGVGGRNATGTESDFKTMKLKIPGSNTYQTIAADLPLDRNERSNSKWDYSAYADVTELVKGVGVGEYWGADVHASTGKDTYAGWSLVVAYENTSLPHRDLKVFGGYQVIQSGKSESVSISGFRAPEVGPVNATIGAVVYEGDTAYGGDSLKVNNTLLSDQQTPSNNFFNGRITAGGEIRRDRNPAYDSTFIDAKTVDTVGVIQPDSTTATVTFSTTSDRYYPAVLTTQIDLATADMVGHKTVKNLNGSSSSKVGDTLEYTMTWTNEGKDTAIDAVLTDKLPPNVQYVPGSLKINPGTPEEILPTDVTDDDVAEVSGNIVTVRLGEGADGKNGGSFPIDASATVVLRVKVLTDAAGTTVDNTVDMKYTSEKTEEETSSSSNTAGIPVEKLADLGVNKEGPKSVKAGENAQWTLTVTNDGPNEAENVSVTDTLPPGVTFSSSKGADCTENDGELTCALGTLADGETRTIILNTLVKADTAAGTVTNTARVKSSTPDHHEDNNKSGDSAQVSRAADLAITKSVEPQSIAPGEEITYTLEASNLGPSTAINAKVTDTLPEQMTATSIDDRCENTDGELTCVLGDLAVGAEETITIKAKLSDSWNATEPIKNTAQISSETPDLTDTNDSSAASFTPTAPQADLSVAKRTVGDQVQAGMPVEYEIIVTNNGPSRAYGVSVDDTVPDGVTSIQASTTSGTCQVTGSNVHCDIGELPVTGTATVRVSAHVDEGVTGELKNTATVDSTSEDPESKNDSASVTNTVATSADLIMTKTATAVEPVAGNEFSYDLTVKNNGPSDAQNVVITDTLPAHVTYLSANTSGNCSVTDATVTCSYPTLADGAEETSTIHVKLKDDVGDDTVIDNTASVTSDTSDPDTTNNEGTVSLVTDAHADLAVSKTGPKTVVAGQDIEWTITVTNNGPSEAVNATLTDTIPDGVTGISVDANTCSVTDSTVDCAFGDIAPDASQTVTVRGTVSSDFENETLNNRASADSDTEDPAPSNNFDSSLTAVTRSADLNLAKTTEQATVRAGETVMWTLIAGNDGPSVARGVKITDILPQSVSFIESTSDDGVKCEATDETVECSLESLLPKEQAKVTITARVAPTVADDSTVTNSASVASDTPESEDDKADNSAQSSVNVKTEADVSVTKSVTPERLISGAEGTYLVTVTNGGPSTARQVTFTDSMPTGLTPTSVQGPGTCSIAGQDVNCTFDSIAPNMSRNVYITVDVAADAPETVTNRVEVSSPTDNTPGNNTGTVTTGIADDADLAMTKVADRDTVNAGEVITYTLGVVNNGPSTAHGVTITDQIPAGTDVQEHDDRCELEDHTLTCAIGNLVAGESAAPQITVSIPDDSEVTSIVNEATVSSSTNDSNADNNSAEASVAVSTSADLSVTKSASDMVKAGQEMTWTIAVRNAGPSYARNVTVKDTMPGGLSIVSATMENGDSCDVVGQEISCLLGDIPIGLHTVTVTVDVPANFAADSVTNGVQVDSSTADPDDSNNGADKTVQVVRDADLQLSKTLKETNPVPGESVNYTLTVSNLGPSDSSDVTVNDLLPRGLNDITVTGKGPDDKEIPCEVVDTPYIDDETDEIVTVPVVGCSFGTLAAGQKGVVEVHAIVSPDLTGQLTNNALVGSTTPDHNSENNAAAVTADLTPRADLSLTKTADQAEVVAGELVTYTLTATNSGPSTATNVVVAEEIPRGLELESHDDRCSLAPSEESLICDLGTLSVNQSEEFIVTYRVESLSTADVISNSAAISSGVDDPTDDNNVSSADIAVTTLADVSITKSGPQSVVPGKSVTWILDVSNTGPSAARDLVISDVLPSGLKDIEVTGTAPTGSANCVVKPKENSSGLVTCSFAVLDVNTDATVTITALVKPGLTGELANSATVQASTPDPDDSNNASTVATALIPTDTLPVTGVNAVSQMISAFALLTVGVLLVLTRRRKLT